MLHISNFSSLMLQFILCQFYIQDIETAWPSLNSSSIQLLGLFPDPLNTTDPSTMSVHCRAMFKAAVLLSQQYNITIDGKLIDWQTVQTGGSPIDALSATCRAIPYSNIVGIVGPALSREAHLIAEYATTIGIPVVSYSATDPDLSDRNAYPAFYSTVSSDNAAALSLVKLFIQYNWTSCVIIYQNDAYGSGGARIISKIFNDNNLKIIETIVFDIVTLSIRDDLKTILLTSSTRIVILWTDSLYTPFILQNALDANVLGPYFTWIISGNIPLDSFNRTVHDQLIGIFSIEPVPGNVVNAPINSILLNSAYDIWQQYEPESFPGSNMVDYYALFTFDATWSLIQSLQQLCLKTSPCISILNSSSFCFDYHLNNSNLLFQQINTIGFLGVSGLIEFISNRTDRINGIYYLIQNIQPSSNSIKFVPVLVWSMNSDWKPYTGTNVIIWPGNTLVPANGQATTYGVKLRIGVIEAAPFTMITNIIDESGKSSTKLIGYIPDLIDLLEKKMNFIPQVIVVPSNETYNQLIDDVANGIYDMVIGDVTITATRREKVGFSNSIFDNSLRIITRKKFDEGMDLIAFLRPLSLKLWIVLLIATICAGFLICLFEKHENDILKNRSLFSSIAMSIWYSFGNMMGYGVDFSVITATGRLITAGLYMLSLIIVATYTANLASDLTTAKTKDIITGIDDIKNGKVSFSRIGIVVNSSIEEYYLREISDNNRNFYPLKSESEIYINLLNNIIDVAIMDAGILEYATSTYYCNLTLIGTDFDKSAFGIVISKQWLYTQNLDVNILSLREAGELDDLKRLWFQGSTCSNVDDIPTGTTIEALSGLFVIFAVICSLALILFIWQKYSRKENYLSKN